MTPATADTLFLIAAPVIVVMMGALVWRRVK